MSVEWNQSKFDETLKAYLMAHESQVWPRALNKKAFFVALGAIPTTPKVKKEIIVQQLATTVKAKRKNGTSDDVPIGFVIAAKRASKHWSGVKSLRTAQALQKGKGFSEANLWRQLVTNRFKAMLGGRTRAAGFLRVGWVSVLRQLGPVIGQSYSRGQSEADSKLRGVKGTATPATPGQLSVTIINTAKSTTEKSGGFEREGNPALQRSLEREQASMIAYLEGEMEPGIKQFNSQQR